MKDTPWDHGLRVTAEADGQAAVDQDGAVQDDKHVAEITHLLSRAAGWPAGLRWLARRTRPSRRQSKNLTAFERATGWRYSIIVTNIPAAGGIGGVPGSHHASSSTCCTASTPSSKTRCGRIRPWACGTCHRRPGR